MRHVLFSGVILFSLVGSAIASAEDAERAAASALVPSGDPEGLVNVPPAFQACVLALCSDIEHGITAFNLRVPPPAERVAFLRGRVSGLLMRRRQMPSEDNARADWVAAMFRPLVETGIISRAVAEEFRVRGLWRASSVERAVMEFETNFRTAEQQHTFLNAVAARVLHRVIESNGFITGFSGVRGAERAALDRVTEFLTEGPYSRFAELQLYILSVFIWNDHLALFARDCARYVPWLINPYRIYESWSGQLWSTVNPAVAIRGADRDLTTLRRHLATLQPRARDLIVTRNLSLFTREHLVLLRSRAGEIGLSAATLGAIEEVLRQPPIGVEVARP